MADQSANVGAKHRRKRRRGAAILDGTAGADYKFKTDADYIYDPQRKAEQAGVTNGQWREAPPPKYGSKAAGIGGVISALNFRRRTLAAYCCSKETQEEHARMSSIHFNLRFTIVTDPVKARSIEASESQTGIVEAMLF
ncbi:hypothetical protein E4U59_000055 [Claviceps monticola]|nr:hypothetical protein E4U59_000055 [Claviceps monticola]